MSIDRFPDLHCSRCDRLMGDVSLDELEHVLADENDVNLCFDCDPDSAATTPSVFWMWQENELFDIGDTGFQVRDQKLCVIGHARARAHDARARTCLSSYTYLNRISKNRAILPDGMELTACQKCRGTGELDGFAFIQECDNCDGMGVVETAIVIPSWIISHEVIHV